VRRSSQGVGIFGAFEQVRAEEMVCFCNNRAMLSVTRPEWRGSRSVPEWGGNRSSLVPVSDEVAERRSPFLLRPLSRSFAFDTRVYCSKATHQSVELYDLHRDIQFVAWSCATFKMAHRAQISDGSRSIVALLLSATPLYLFSIQARCKSLRKWIEAGS
jgi:hypothetical protein